MGRPCDSALVYLSVQPLEVFSRYVQEREKSSEAGGILLGHVRGTHLEILEATEPSFWDRRFRYFFERMPYRHQGIDRRRWSASNGFIRYIGEWHSHPQDQSSPSSIDPHEWQLLAKGRCDRRALLSLIVGRMICILNTWMQLGGDKRSCGGGCLIVPPGEAGQCLSCINTFHMSRVLCWSN